MTPHHARYRALSLTAALVAALALPAGATLAPAQALTAPAAATTSAATPATTSAVTASVAATPATASAATASVAAAPSANPAAAPAQTPAAAGFLVGVGKADMTGEPAENGMMGYGDGAQKTSGIHMRQYARAYVIADAATGERVLMVNADMLNGTNLMRTRILDELRQRFGDVYTDANVMIVGTHTHATPGGNTDYSLYNVTTMGVHNKTLNASVDGIVRAVEEAEASLAPGTLALGESTLTDAGVNRSRRAWDRNPQELKDALPDAKDPSSRTVTLRVSDETVGAINWFATHPTSLTSKNTLISGDNKGYAEYLWEGERGGIAAFVSASGADQSPNLNLSPGSGPTEDEFENMRIIGQRQYDAAVRGADAASPVAAVGAASAPVVDSAIVWLDMQNQQVAPEFSTTGVPQATCRAILGAPFGAGSTEDGGGGATFLSEGVDGNPFFALFTNASYRRDPAFEACQSPKATLFESGVLDGVQTTLPVQLFRVGDVWIAGLPGEVTGASGVMMRQAIADATGASTDRILITSNANAYGHYFTTPWEYDQQDYEGGATIFGRYTTPALVQGLDTVAANLADGTAYAPGRAPYVRYYVSSRVGVVLHDSSGTRKYGDVLTQPAAQVAPGETVSARFQGAHPNNNIRHEGTFLSIERLAEDGTWQRVADDNDFSTRFEWKRHLAAQSHVTISWDVPDDAAPGTYRIVYYGTWQQAVTKRHTEFTGVSNTFRVG